MLKISIITPSLNQGRFIREAIESVLSQHDPCFEHIVVDGGSSDSTLDILKSYPHLKWISEKDRGQSDAFNKGLAMATGDIVGEINADDYFLPDTFQQVRTCMSRPGAMPVCVGACHFVRAGRTVMTWQPVKVNLKEALRFPVAGIPHPSLFAKRSLLISIGGMDASIRHGPDVDLILRLAKKTDFACISSPLAVSRLHEDAIQEKEWDHNFTAALYHVARNGDPQNFHEMYVQTHARFAVAQNAHLTVPLLHAFIRKSWQVLGAQGAGKTPLRLAIFGAGSHTQWLEQITRNVDPAPSVVAVLDDVPKSKPILWGLPALLPSAWDTATANAVLLSSDTFADKMSDRCRTLFGDRIPLINLYDSLPQGPYRK